MNAFIDGEADAYAKRNARGPEIEPWFKGLLQTIDFHSVVDLGCGVAEHRLVVAHSVSGCRTLGVEAASGEDHVTPRQTMLFGRDIETFDIPECDLVMFSYILHWLPEAHEVLQRAMKVSKYILINDFFPDDPIDNPYAHCEGVVTRKRRYGMYCADAGWVRHIAVSYRYHNNPDDEPCQCEIWRKP